MHPEPPEHLSWLTGPVEPPPALKQSVTESLRARGLLAAGTGGGRRLSLAGGFLYGGAAVLLLAVGLLIGRKTSGGAPAQDPRPRFALLLYEDTAFLPGRAHAELVAEYSAWADSLRGQGKLVMGEELVQEETVTLAGSGDAGEVSPGDVKSEAGVIGGFFIVRASGFDDALAIARQSPHLRHGGRVVLRRLTGGEDQ